MTKKQLGFIALLTILLCGINILGFFYRSYPNILALDLSRELAVSLKAISTLSAITVVVYGLMQIPSGILTDKFGAGKTLFYLGIIGVIACFGFALSSNFNTMFFYRMIMGIGLAAVVPSQVLLIHTVPPQNFATVNGVFFASGALGTMVAASPLIWLSNLFGWRIAISFFTLANVLLLLCLIPFIRKEKSIQKPQNTLSFLSGFKLILISKDFWLMAIWLMSTSGVMWALTNMWFGPYVMEACNLSQVQAGRLIVVFSTAMIISPLIFGYCTDRFKIKKKHLMLIASAGSFFSSLVWVIGTGKISFLFLVINSFVFMFFIMGACSLTTCLAKEKFPPQLMGTVIGALCMSFPLWSGIAQIIYGNLLQNFLANNVNVQQAYSMANIFWTITILIGGIAVTMIEERTHPRA